VSEAAPSRLPLGLLAALVVGALVRVVQLWWASEQVPDFAAPVLDAGFHHYWASLLVDASTPVPEWMDDPELATTPFYRPPGYVWWLALLYLVSGGSVLFAKAAQLVVGLLGIAAVYALARQLAEERAATVAAFVAALCPSLVYFEGELVAAAPASVVVTVWVALALRWSSAGVPTGGRALALGLLLGVACLLRPNLLVLVAPLALVWWLRWDDSRLNSLRRRDGAASSSSSSSSSPPSSIDRAAAIKASAALLAGVVLSTVPVTVRNQVVGGEAVWISMNGPVTLRYGNSEMADGHHMRLPTTGVLAGLTEVSASGYPKLRRHVAHKLGRPVSTPSQTPPGALTWGDLGSILRKESTGWMAAHPGDALSLTLRKALMLLGPTAVSNNKQVQLIVDNSPVLRSLPARWWLMAPLALVGAMSLLRRRRHRSLALVLGSLAILLAAVVPFLAGARFRLPVMGLLAALAGVGLVALVDALRKDDGNAERLPLVATAIVGALLFAVNWTGYAPDVSRWHLDRATALLRAQRDEAARVELDAALSSDPRAADAYRQRGLLYARQGDGPRALADLQQAVSLGGGPAAEAALATVQTQQGSVDEGTLAQFEALLSIDPDRVDVLYNYASALLTLRRAADAKKAYERLLTLDPAHTDGRNNYGRLLLDLGDARGAIAQFDEVMKHRGEHLEATYNRAVAYARIDPAVAEVAYRELLARHPDHVAAQLNLGAMLIDRGEPGQARTLLEPAASKPSAPSGLLFNYARAAWLSGDEATGLDALRRSRAERLRLPDAPGPSPAAIDLLLAEWLITARTPSLRAPAEAVSLTKAVVEGAAWGHPIPIRAFAAALAADGKPADAAAARTRADALCAAQPGAFGPVCDP
jgi:Tfp pilus assembly protein PilF